MEAAPGSKARAGKRPVRIGCLALVVMLALAAFVADRTGWLGYGWAHLRSSLFPRDEALLAWVPAETRGVAIVDFHRLHLERLQGGQSSVRASIERVRNDVRGATGVDLGF